MFNNHTIVCVTASGRRRYMRYLVPQVLSSPWVDRYDIWVHTMDLCDIEFLKQLAVHYPKIRLVWQSEGIIDGMKTINSFYRDCIDSNTIYIKLDDDIIWLDPEFFSKTITFRLEHPEYFLVSPLVINNAKSTYILQVCEKLQLQKYQNAESFGPMLWESSDFALELHHWFLQNYLTTNRYNELFCGAIPIGITRFSINAIAWRGEDMQLIEGIVDGDDEEFLSSILPTRLGRSNCFYCDAIAVHFAFCTQRSLLDQGRILDFYGQWIASQWASDPELSTYDQTMKSILYDIERRTSQILKQSHPYSEVSAHTSELTIRQRIFSYLPQIFEDLYLLFRKQFCSQPGYQRLISSNG